MDEKQRTEFIEGVFSGVFELLGDEFNSLTEYELSTIKSPKEIETEQLEAMYIELHNKLVTNLLPAIVEKVAALKAEDLQEEIIYGDK